MLLVGPPMPDRSRVMTQTKRDTLVLPGWGLGVRLTTPPREKNTVTKPQEEAKAHPGL
jgi:hypothetical protein